MTVVSAPPGAEAAPPGAPEALPGDGSERRPDAEAPARGRDPLWARLLIGFGVLLVLASAGTLSATELLTQRYDSSVKRESLLAPQARAEAATKEDVPERLVGPLNFLLLGSDARPDDPDAGQRTDTIIVAHVPATLDRVFLLSIPRDLRVQIPPYEPTGFSGRREKINAAFEYGGGGNGGIQLLSMTLANLLGVGFDGAAVVDFTGFKDVVKALGGVDMCVETRVVSEHIAFDRDGRYVHPNDGGTRVVYEPGCQLMNDWQALDYVRQRYSLPDGDYGRQRHQQQFLQALVTRARAQGITNPVKLDRLIRAVAGTLTVDTGGRSIESLLFGLRDIRPGNFTGITLPSEPRDIGDTSYVVAFDEATAMFEALRTDTLDTWVSANPRWVNQL